MVAPLSSTSSFMPQNANTDGTSKPKTVSYFNHIMRQVFHLDRKKSDKLSHHPIHVFQSKSRNIKDVSCWGFPQLNTETVGQMKEKKKNSLWGKTSL